MYSLDSVSLCLHAKYLKKLQTVLMKFIGEVERGPRRNRLDFIGYQDSFVDPGSFSRTLYC